MADEEEKAPGKRDDSKLDLPKLYQKMTGPRSSYLDRGHDIATITLPWLAPKGEEIKTSPFSSLGTQGVRSLSATTHRLTMPTSVQWWRFNVDKKLRAVIKAGEVKGITEDGLDAELSDAENTVATYLENTNARSKSGMAFLRNMVEGNTMVNVLKEGIRTFPLRSFVVKRNPGFGDVRIAIVEERLPKDDLMEAVSTDEVGRAQHRQSEEQADKRLYTLIDYELGEVWQQDTDEDNPKQVEQEVDQWFIFVPNIPELGSYSVGYAHEYFGLINEINLLSESLGEITAAAALNIPIVRPEGPSKKKLESLKRGEWLVTDPEMLDAFGLGVDPSKAAVVVARLLQLREEMAQVFAMGIKDRAFSVSTATEVLQIVQELETVAVGLLTAIEESFQRPLIKAIMLVEGLLDLRIPEDNRVFKIDITTGVNALQREAALLRYIEIAQKIMAMDPTLVLDGLKAMELAGDTQLIPTEGLIRRLSQEEMSAAEEQLAGMAQPGQVKENGQRRGTIMTAGGPQPPQPPQPGQPPQAAPAP